MVTLKNKFSSSDLLQYTEMLLRESLQETTNYSWLKSRHIQPEVQRTFKELEKLRPMVQKLTSENCTKIAVKFDSLTDGVYSAAAILDTFKKLLQEQYSIQIMEYNVMSAKEGKKRMNRVLPELVPDGKIPSVSFIVKL